MFCNEKVNCISHTYSCFRFHFINCNTINSSSTSVFLKKMATKQSTSVNDHKTDHTTTGVKVLGVQFVPNLLNISRKRRLETISVITWFIIFIAYPLISYGLIFIMFLIPPLWGFLFTFVIPYLIWMWLFDRKTPCRGARHSKWVRNWSIWKHFNNYFPVKLVKSFEENLDPQKNYLFCGHPHGLLCTGIFACFGTNGNPETQVKFPNFKFSILTFDASFMFPFVRELVLKLGLCSASRESMNYLLSRKGGGNIAILIPGGAPEALDFCPGTYILQLKKRKGFIKVALQNGSPLVPVFSFGENTVLNQIPNPPGSILRWMQDTFQRLFIIPPVLFYGRGVFQYTLGFLPKRKPITVVVGAPIPLEKVDSPTQSQIDELHEKYMRALTELFENYKGKYSANPHDVLVIR